MRMRPRHQRPCDFLSPLWATVRGGHCPHGGRGADLLRHSDYRHRPHAGVDVRNNTCICGTPKYSSRREARKCYHSPVLARWRRRASQPQLRRGGENRRAVFNLPFLPSNRTEKTAVAIKGGWHKRCPIQSNERNHSRNAESRASHDLFALPRPMQSPATVAHRTGNLTHSFISHRRGVVQDRSRSPVDLHKAERVRDMRAACAQREL